MMTRPITFLAAVLLVLTVTVVADAQTVHEAIVTTAAPLRLYPDLNRAPLATLTVGTVLRVLGREGDWFRVSFKDRRWGERAGVVEVAHVKLSAGRPVAEPAIASSLPEAKTITPAPEPEATRKKPRWWEVLAAGLAVFAEGYAAGNRIFDTTLGGKKLMVFGGRGHDMYLGCLSCNEFASDSLFNEFGRHGNQFQSNSIFNSFGQFGSAYSRYSVCNPYASDPPVIVDGDGRFYGRLTVNQSHHQQVRDPEVKAFVMGLCAGR